jgi:sugar lactone lactonase YvrE
MIDSNMVETLTQQIVPATDFACELAENPLWDLERNCVYWTDITAGKMYSLDLNSGLHRLIYQGPTVGGFTLQQDGKLLLFRVDDIALIEQNGIVSIQQKVPMVEWHASMMLLLIRKAVFSPARSAKPTDGRTLPN